MNLRSLDDLKKNDAKKDDKDKKTTNSYTGGTSSGMNVENPEEDWMDKMKKKSNNKEGFDKTENKIQLTVYKNGFKIDEGQFRDVKEPNNKKFMEEIEKGYIPQELVEQGYKNLAIALMDKKTEVYTEPIPEKKFEAFGGGGTSMGTVMSEGLGINKDVAFHVDKNKQTTKINFRLYNGESLTQEFNLTHTIGDIFEFISSAAPVLGTFVLIEGFPPKPLTEMNKTIDEAKIRGTTIIQKLC